jgi:hypothetical protein
MDYLNSLPDQVTSAESNDLISKATRGVFVFAFVPWRYCLTVDVAVALAPFCLFNSLPMNFEITFVILATLNIKLN